MSRREFRFLTVPAGPYELTAEKKGFTKVLHSAFAVRMPPTSSRCRPADLDLVWAKSVAWPSAGADA